MKGKLKFWKVFLTLFGLVYVFGVVLRILGILFNAKLERQPLTGVKWDQVFLLGELDGRSELITPRWWIRVASIILLPAALSGLIVNQKISFK